MSNKITIKRSSVPAKVPTAADLDYGEIAINYADGNLFFKDSLNVVTTIASTQFVSVTGNITGGNVNTSGQIQVGQTVSAVGNIAGSYFIGNGSLLTGINPGTQIGGNLIVGLRSGADVKVQVQNGFLQVVSRAGTIFVPVSP